MAFRVERWSVQPKELPKVWRHCSGCGVTSPFVCSKKFRANAQKKVIDVWLIYRCAACESAWNLPIESRCAVAAMDAALRIGYERNDRMLAWACAFDLHRLRRYCSRIEVGDAIEIHRSAVQDTDSPGDRVYLDVAYACGWRLDRLLAHQLGMTRSRLMRWEESGRLRVLPAMRRPLRRPVQNKMEVVFEGMAVLGH